jgi:site-specific DNA-cytosine methylase
MRFGSLFCGAGCADIGLERAGLRCAWQVEISPDPRSILERHWPATRRHDDVRTFPPADPEDWLVDLIVGGDPCPYRSRARSIHGTDSTDLWPEFLRIVQTLRPLWVLRENVVSDDIDDCWADISRAGYVAIVLETDGSQVTGQSRSREYLCGVLGTSGICPGSVFSQPESAGRGSSTNQGPEPIAVCLTTKPQRFETSGNYIFEPGRGTRILSPVERERLQGLPEGHTAGLSDRKRARAIGNGLITTFPEWIGRRIMKCTKT